MSEQFSNDSPATDQGLEVLALRAYPGLKYSGFCSQHRDTGHFECQICYPDLNRLLAKHIEVFNWLYDELLKISGLSDPPNGRIGTKVILDKLKRRCQ